MDFQRWQQLKTVEHLHGYEPNETQYSRFYESNPALLATGHKIEDFYQYISRARAMLYYACPENWQVFSGPDEVSRKTAQSQMVFSAMLIYSASLDITWQIVWANFTASSFETLTQGEYQVMQSECAKDSLNILLSDTARIPGEAQDKATHVKQLINDFDRTGTVPDKVRNLNNHFKHRGAIHIPGLGLNDDTFNGSVNGRTLPILHRLSVDLEELEILLMEYHDLIVQHVNDLLPILMPSDYVINTMSAEDFIVSLMSSTERLDNPQTTLRSPLDAE